MTDDTLQPVADDAQDTSTFDSFLTLVAHWKLLVLLPLLVGSTALGVTYLIAPTFTARTSFLPPQQQGGAAAALSSLGALASLAGGSGTLRTPAEQFVTLLQSTTIQDRLVDKHRLLQVYESDYRFEARKELAERTRVLLGRRDGVVSLEVDDKSPERAKALADDYVAELRELTSNLALTEAQQRRRFFEQELAKTAHALELAQKAMQATGFNASALNAEPKAAAEVFARLQADVTAAEIRVRALRSSLAEGAPELQHQLAILDGLRRKLPKQEVAALPSDADDYVSRYREYKYQENLFEIFSRQYELARVDEARDGPLIQVIDAALIPERKSKPQRATIAVAATLASGVMVLIWLLARNAIRRHASTTHGAEQLSRLVSAWRGR